jgi:hypothetical protein
MSSNRGGKRIGSGRKKGEETTTYKFRIAVKRLNELREKYGKQLSKMFNNWQKEL